MAGFNVELAELMAELPAAPLNNPLTPKKVGRGDIPGNTAPEVFCGLFQIRMSNF